MYLAKVLFDFMISSENVDHQNRAFDFVVEELLDFGFLEFDHIHFFKHVGLVNFGSASYYYKLMFAPIHAGGIHAIITDLATLDRRRFRLQT